jgi:hypothetical protein
LAARGAAWQSAGRASGTPWQNAGRADSTAWFCTFQVTLRRDLEEGCRQLQGFHAVVLLPTQIVLRELQTLSGHPDRLHEWTQAAVEMAHKYA